MIHPRPAADTDRGFIVQTWVRSFADNPNRWVSETRTRQEHWLVVDAILAGSETRTVVLSSPGNARAIHAWACAAPGALHYVYVPPELRGYGLGRRVISAALGDYPPSLPVTHPWPRTSARFRWDPYPLFAALAGAEEAFRAIAQRAAA